MSEQNTSIHDFDLQLIGDYYSRLYRQGPGSPEVTLKALDFVGKLPKGAAIADLGCGTGGQTMVLAQNTSAHITGIDLFPRFIELFNQNAQQLNLQKRVKGVVGSMMELPFETGSLDLIWSEGAIYNIGFERGLQEWRAFLKTGAFVAITEASWFTSERPAEIDEFWKKEYPGIDTIPAKVNQMQDAGYLPVATFVLPENCWTDHFYVPQQSIEESFLKDHPDDKKALAFVANEKHGRELYYSYKDFYGYVFYIGKKI